MSDHLWAIFVVLISNIISISFTVFFNRSRDVKDAIKDVAILKENVRLFREECQERHSKKGRK